MRLVFSIHEIRENFKPMRDIFNPPHAPLGINKMSPGEAWEIIKKAKWEFPDLGVPEIISSDPLLTTFVMAAFGSFTSPHRDMNMACFYTSNENPREMIFDWPPADEYPSDKPMPITWHIAGRSALRFLVSSGLIFDGCKRFKGYTPAAKIADADGTIRFAHISPQDMS